MDRIALEDSNFAFLNTDLVISCLVTDAFQREVVKSALGHTAAAASFKCWGDTSASIKFDSAAARRLVDRGIDGLLLGMRCLDATFEDRNEACETTVDDLSVSFRIVEYFQRVDGELVAVDPLESGVPDHAPLGRTVEMRVIERVPA